MKGTFSLTSLAITASAIFLLVASYQVDEVPAYFSKGDADPLLYPRVLLFALTGLGLVVFVREFLTGNKKLPLTLSVYILSGILIAYYYIFIYIKFYISTVLLCAVIVFLVERKFTLGSITLCLLLPLGTWVLFNYGLDLQIQFMK
ncbi:tripartite tricarboxylate transporter TctB family protein [Desulfocastanea catecholica]